MVCFYKPSALNHNYQCNNIVNTTETVVQPMLLILLLILILF